MARRAKPAARLVPPDALARVEADLAIERQRLVTLSFPTLSREYHDADLGPTTTARAMILELTGVKRAELIDAATTQRIPAPARVLPTSPVEWTAFH